MDRPLKMLRSETLTEIGAGRYILQFCFDSARRPVIGAEGDWELIGPERQLLDRDVDPTERETYRFGAILNRDVVGCEVTAPESFALRLDSGHQFRVFDRSPQYEWFSNQSGDDFVWPAMSPNVALQLTIGLWTASAAPRRILHPLAAELGR
jgi:hypothetical protein